MTKKILIDEAVVKQVLEAMEKPAFTHAAALQNLSEALELVLRWIDDWCETGPETGFDLIEEKANAALEVNNKGVNALVEQPDYSICPACGGIASDPIVPVEARQQAVQGNDEVVNAMEPVAMRYRFHYPDDGSKPYRTGEWKYTQGPWDKIPGNARDVSALSLHAAPTQQPLTELWERLPGHLIDKYEGETLTEELLQQAVAELVRQYAHGITGSKEGGAA